MREEMTPSILHQQLSFPTHLYSIFRDHKKREKPSAHHRRLQMTKIYPKTTSPEATTSSHSGHHDSTMVLTVWRKSLLFNGKGFTVFDGKGNLSYRVENYSCSGKGEVVLMNSVGAPLLTVRRKRMGFGDQWLIYSGEDSTAPLFSVKKHLTLVGNSKLLAKVTALSSCGIDRSTAYEIEGSYTNRSCFVYDDQRRKMAEVRRKEVAAGGVAFGDDVFRLVVEPELDTAVAMALVILLDQMF